jgi:hypothetical protein
MDKATPYVTFAKHHKTKSFYKKRVALLHHADVIFNKACLNYANSGSAYASIGGQAQIRFLSPWALSTRATLGQNLASFTHFNG